MKKLKNLLLASLTSLAFQAQAGLITGNLIVPGDSLTTYDDHTGNLWIKSSVTKGMSYNQVEHLIANTYLYSGFRIADFDDMREVVGWYSEFKGQDPIMPGVAIFYDNFVAPIELDPSKNFSVRSGYGYTGQPRSFSETVKDREGWARAWGGVFGCDGAIIYGACWGAFEELGSNDGASPRGKDQQGYGGFFLVKQVVNVPEPGPIALLAAGIALFGLKRKYRAEL